MWEGFGASQRPDAVFFWGNNRHIKLHRQLLGIFSDLHTMGIIEENGLCCRDFFVVVVDPCFILSPNSVKTINNEKKNYT